MWSPHGVDWYKAQFQETIKALSDRGVVFVLPTPMRPLRPQRPDKTIDDIFPQCLATAESGIIMVGGTDQEGRLWWESMLGSEGCPVSVYAQGHDVQA